MVDTVKYPETRNLPYRSLKNDMKILAAMGIKVLRTYNTHYKQAANLLQAISELKAENTDFEMYVMLGVWIDCQNAWTNTSPNHDAENEEANASEIQRAVGLANKHPDIVKIIAVGNEAMGENGQQVTLYSLM